MEPKIQQRKSAFLIELTFWKTCEKGGIQEMHDIPILLLESVNEVIYFLNRYTCTSKFYPDMLEFKAELKNVNCSFEIADFELLQKEILIDDVYGITEILKGNYNQHLIAVKRLAFGIHKRTLITEFY